MKKTISLILVLAMVLAVSAGCGQTPSGNNNVPANNTMPANNTEPEKPATMEVTDMKGRTVTIPAKVEKVVVTFNLEEYFAVAGSEGLDKLVGWSHKYWKGRRDDAYNAFTKAFPKLKDLPDVGYNGDISIESIISLKPDVVLASSTGANYNALEPAFENLRKAGIECIFFDFHKQTIETHKKSIELLGKVLGQEARAAEIGKFYEDQMKVISDRLKDLKDEDRPRVYMEFSMGPSQFGNTWSEQMWGALIKQCGGTNIAAGMEGASVEIAPEQIISANPQVIIFACSPRTDVSDNVVLGYGADKALAVKNIEAYKARAGWADLDAVKNNRMGGVYHDLSRHIFDFAGAQALAKMIQPELFKDIDPEANLAEFFKKYMPVELDGIWTIQLDK